MQQPNDQMDQHKAKYANSNWCCWVNRPLANHRWCCVSSKVNSMNSKRVPSVQRSSRKLYALKTQQSNLRFGIQPAKKGSLNWTENIFHFCHFDLFLEDKKHLINVILIVKSGYRYHSLAPMYYRGAQAAIVVYDIQNQDSFQRAKTWVKELQRQVNFNCEITYKAYTYNWKWIIPKTYFLGYFKYVY